jgi:hypothetical protein
LSAKHTAMTASIGACRSFVHSSSVKFCRIALPQKQQWLTQAYHIDSKYEIPRASPYSALGLGLNWVSQREILGGSEVGTKLIEEESTGAIVMWITVFGGGLRLPVKGHLARGYPRVRLGSVLLVVHSVLVNGFW